MTCAHFMAAGRSIRSVAFPDRYAAAFYGWSRQKERLQTRKASRDQTRVAGVLQELRGAAESDVNLLPHIIRCVEHQATLGEISDTLRAAWGEFQVTE